MTQLLEKLDELETLLKHQPGRHDQQSHAGSRGSSGGKGGGEITSASHAADKVSSSLSGIDGLKTSAVKTASGSTMKYTIKPTKGSDYDKSKARTAAQKAVKDSLSKAGFKPSGSGRYKKGNISARMGNYPDSDEKFIAFSG